jgi:hypothetical protein
MMAERFSLVLSVQVYDVGSVAVTFRQYTD